MRGAPSTTSYRLNKAPEWCTTVFGKGWRPARPLNLRFISTFFAVVKRPLSNYTSRDRVRMLLQFIRRHHSAPSTSNSCSRHHLGKRPFSSGCNTQIPGPPLYRVYKGAVPGDKTFYEEALPRSQIEPS